MLLRPDFISLPSFEEVRSVVECLLVSSPDSQDPFTGHFLLLHFGFDAARLLIYPVIELLDDEGCQYTLEFAPNSPNLKR